ncbi:MAG TPA: hypothetical protein VN734_16615 [Acidobacteriaceae bacterium]|nr:hypothetical protein [Acidobacteriaceae bacterium]
MPLGILKSLYGVLVLFAVALGIVFYRKDLEDDLPTHDTSDSFISLSPLVSRGFMGLLAIGLAEGIWSIRNESWAMILILPVNAMWLWGTYVTSLDGVAKSRLRSSQKTAGA